MGAWYTPPPGSAITCMLKMLLMYFKFVNLILVFWHSISWKNLNCNFWTKKAWFPARYVTISVKVKHFSIDEIKLLNFQKIHYHIQKFFVPKYFFAPNWELYSEKLYFFPRAISIYMHDKNLTSNMPLFMW